MASTQKFELNASIRHTKGKGASRRLRRAASVPGIVYGASKEPLPLTFEHKLLVKALDQESFYSRIVTLNIENDTVQVILKDVQRHPYKPEVLHVDFQRINPNEKLHMHIPLHFIGAETAPGLKEGGVLSHNLTDVEITCLPADLPEYIEVDIANLALNGLVHLSELKLPTGVEIVALAHGHDNTVVSIHLPRIEEEPVEEKAAPAPSEVPASQQKGAESEESGQ